MKWIRFKDRKVIHGKEWRRWYAWRPTYIPPPYNTFSDTLEGCGRKVWLEFYYYRWVIHPIRDNMWEYQTDHQRAKELFGVKDDTNTHPQQVGVQQLAGAQQLAAPGPRPIAALNRIPQPGDMLVFDGQKWVHQYPPRLQQLQQGNTP